MSLIKAAFEDGPQLQQVQKTDLAAHGSIELYEHIEAFFCGHRSLVVYVRILRLRRRSSSPDIVVNVKAKSRVSTSCSTRCSKVSI